MAMLFTLSYHTGMRIADAWTIEDVEQSEIEILLSALLGKDRSWIFAHPEHVMEHALEQRFHEWSNRRRQGEPLSYITGARPFYGRDFLVDARTFIPESSTEGLVDVALEILRGTRSEHILRPVDEGIVAYAQVWCAVSNTTSVADVCTGSGCIGITLACEQPRLYVSAIDVSAHALAVARENAQRHGVAERIHFHEGSLLQPLESREQEPFLLVANPPYVPKEYPLPRELHYEPREAIVAGLDGLDILLPLLRQARQHPACVGFAVECRKDQVPALRNMTMV